MPAFIVEYTEKLHSVIRKKFFEDKTVSFLFFRAGLYIHSHILYTCTKHYLKHSNIQIKY